MRALDVEPDAAEVGDPGLFGPSSVSWQVHADTCMPLAGLRALLLQALHPVAIAGVRQHSSFRTDPWGRLRRTADYVGTVTYGTRLEAERAGARVRGIHRRLSGVDPVTGRHYRVDDPDLLLWVHCTEVESFLTTYRRSGGRLTDADADRYYQEQLRSAALVGLDPAGVPDSQPAMVEYFAAQRPLLQSTPGARAAARFVLLPPMPAWVSLATPARPAWVALSTLAFALLPPWARRHYGLPGLASTDLAGAVGARGLHAGLSLLPASWRDGPRVTAARDRLAVPASPRVTRATLPMAAAGRQATRRSGVDRSGVDKAADALGDELDRDRGEQQSEHPGEQVNATLPE